MSTGRSVTTAARARAERASDSPGWTPRKTCRAARHLRTARKPAGRTIENTWTRASCFAGELREDFDIVVHDGSRDESKSLKLVSGGERVWINECLTRAIALYLSGNTGRRIGTLFSDEADGPLDPEHKRMFMAMKREVLRLGGYASEFFVSQTPELTAMADRIIDLESYSAQGAQVVA